MARLRVALWQCAPRPGDVATNLARLDVAVADAASEGAELLVTPELALTGYDVGRLDALLSPGDVDAVCEIARRHGVALVVGLALSDGSCTWNAAVAVAANGEVLQTYRKAHLFGGLDRDRFVSGTAPFAMVEIAGVRVAMMVCYDVEFPEAVRAAALAGAELVAVPTANMEPYAIVCEAVVPVRAWENQVYVAYANHCGSENGTVYVGRSILAGPDGRAVAVAGPLDEALLVADVDTAVVTAAQHANAYLKDRRPELYTSLVHQLGDPAVRQTSGPA